MQDEYNQFYTTKFAKAKPKSDKPVKGRRAKAVVKNFGKFEKEMNTVLFGFNILLQNIPPHQMIDIVGELMICKTFAPLGVYCITHLQHIIKYDPQASLDDLFAKPMPLSSLKTLIKFMFKSHEVNFEKISKLFQKSATDAKICILEHFYYRTAEEVSLKPMFLKLLQAVCEKNPDVFL